MLWIFLRLNRERLVMPNLKEKEYRQFEDIKYIQKDKSEYWSARELTAVLDYPNGETFKRSLIER